MKPVHLQNINSAEVLLRISDANVPLFGVAETDLIGKAPEYDMVEDELTETKPAWSVGKEFFTGATTLTNIPDFFGKTCGRVKE